MNDTSPKIAEMIRALIEKKTPSERMEMGFSMHATSKHLITRAILEKNPHISNGDLRCEIFLNFYGNDFSAAQREKIIRHLEKIQSPIASVHSTCCAL